MVRECLEETGLSIPANEWHHVETYGIIEVFTTKIEYGKFINYTSDEGHAMWHINGVVFREHTADFVADVGSLVCRCRAKLML
jgi:8-oxo-dGTP pyrophosphatase MutT (NUDIX family)